MIHCFPLLTNELAFRTLNQIQKSKSGAMFFLRGFSYTQFLIKLKIQCHLSVCRLPCPALLAKFLLHRVAGGSTVNEFLPLINDDLVMAMGQNLTTDGTPMGNRKRRNSSVWPSSQNVDSERCACFGGGLGGKEGFQGKIMDDKKLYKYYVFVGEPSGLDVFSFKTAACK